MKKIELFWNIVYYGIYVFDVFLRNLLGYLNPFILINRIKGVKQFHSDQGVTDINKFKNIIFNNPRTGISSVRSGAIIGGVLVLVEYGLFNIFQAISGNDLVVDLWENSTNFSVYLIIFVLPVVFINNLLLFKNDKYLNYFNKFEKLEAGKKRNYILVSLMSLCLIISFFFLSFLLL